jgi:hypothetical protein
MEAEDGWGQVVGLLQVFLRPTTIPPTHHATHHAPRTTHHAPRTTHHAPRTTYNTRTQHAQQKTYKYISNTSKIIEKRNEKVSIVLSQAINSLAGCTNMYTLIFMKQLSTSYPLLCSIALFHSYPFPFPFYPFFPFLFT